jgi:raffinose/stachyose/melibiose transport system substrate-binding protein
MDDDSDAIDTFLDRFDTDWIRYNRDLIQKVKDYEKEKGEN